MYENISFLGKNHNEFHSYPNELSRRYDMLFYYQRRGFLPTLVMMFRVMLAFTHIVLTKQKMVSLCILEIVTHRPMA